MDGPTCYILSVIRCCDRRLYIEERLKRSPTVFFCVVTSPVLTANPRYLGGPLAIRKLHLVLMALERLYLLYWQNAPVEHR